jgi:hypothetical protein
MCGTRFPSIGRGFRNKSRALVGGGADRRIGGSGMVAATARRHGSSRFCWARASRGGRANSRPRPPHDGAYPFVRENVPIP